MGRPVVMRRCREFNEQPPTGPVPLARYSPNVPGWDWQFDRFGANDRRLDKDKIRIRIVNHGKVFVEHVVHRSVIQTSRSLRAKLHASLIWVNWHGSLEVFNMYAAWLYSDSESISTSAELNGRDPAAETTRSDYVDLIGCWSMGFTLRNDVYQDQVLRSLRQRLQAWGPENGGNPFVYALTAALVTNVYRATEADTPLRQLIVDTAAKFGHAEDFEHFQSDPKYPTAFAKDLMIALGKERDRRGYILVAPRLIPVYVEEYPFPPLRPPPPRPVWPPEEDEEDGYVPCPLPFCNAKDEVSTQQPPGILKKTGYKKTRFLPVD